MSLMVVNGSEMSDIILQHPVLKPQVQEVSRGLCVTDALGWEMYAQ